MLMKPSSSGGEAWIARTFGSWTFRIASRLSDRCHELGTLLPNAWICFSSGPWKKLWFVMCPRNSVFRKSKG